MVTFTLYNFIIRQKRPGKGGAQGPGRAKRKTSSSCSIIKASTRAGAGIFHQKLLTIRELKEYLNENGVEMRL